MHTEEEIKLRQFCQEIINKPRPINKQKYQRDGNWVWCEDWEMIEIMKYLFLGESVYMHESPPRRLKENPLWSKKKIKEKVEVLMHRFITTEKLIEHLRNKRTASWQS